MPSRPRSARPWYLQRTFFYKTLALFSAGFGVSIIIAYSPYFAEVLTGFSQLGLFGAFIAGLLFVSTLTVSTAGLLFFFLAEHYNPLAISLIGAFGSVIVDTAFFFFFNSTVTVQQKKMPLLFRKGPTRWLLMLLGALIVASPLPDEIGIALMGVGRIQPLNFFILTYLFNAAGIFALLSTRAVL